MSVLKVNNTTNPGTPAAGKLRLWGNSATKRLNYTADDGATGQVGGISTVYDVTDYGLKGDGSTDNLAAWNTLYAALPVNATAFFPAGTYIFSGELTCNRDVHLRLLGCGKGRSLLKTSSVTANLFNITVAAYYYSFEELGFGSTVTNKSAGAAIRAAADNAYLDVRRCEFLNQYKGIELVGSTSGNVGTINECLFGTPSTVAGSDTSGAQITVNGSNINMMIENCTINITGISTTGMMVNQSGAVQVNACDFIGGKNTLLVNATGVVSALYFSNVFFDQATLGSTVKFMGTFATSRIKFVECGITNGAAGLAACELAGTGSGTGIPEAIDFTLCDFYNNGFGGTTTGLLATGVRGFDLSNCRVSGFTVGIDITSYSAAGVTNFNIQGCTVGPTENFSANGTGIRINAGSFTYGQSCVSDCDLSGNTTANLVNNGAYSTGALLLTSNIGLAVQPAPLVATPATIAAVETVVHQISLPANSLLVGSTIKFYASGILTGTTPSILPRLRIGTLGTIGDTQVCATVAAVMTTATGWKVEGFLTVRSIGSGGACLGQVRTLGEALATADRVSAQTATVVVNTTVANFLSLTLIGGGTTPVVTVVQAHAEIVRQ